MLIRPLSLLALLLIVGCASERDATSPNAESEPIFRYVDLGQLGRFELGQPLGDYARYAIEQEPNTYRLREGAFGGAESILVTTDERGIVRCIGFEYGPNYKWKDMLANYSESLGTPARAAETEVIWNDGQTEFALIREAGTSYVAEAEMRDLTGSR